MRRLLGSCASCWHINPAPPRRRWGPDLLKTRHRRVPRTLFINDGGNVAFIDGGNVHGRDELMACLRELGGAPELQSHPHKFLITVSHRPGLPAQVLESIVGLHDLLQRLRRVGRHSRAFFCTNTQRAF